MDKKREFLLKLKSLLSEYDASICFNVDDCSDVCGIYGERMAINFGYDEILSVDGWSLDSLDLTVIEA